MRGEEQGGLPKTDKPSGPPLRDFCRGRIAGYKIPRRIILSDDLPRGPTGKILKRRLRELL